MDKSAAREKRKKNLSFKVRKDKQPVPEKKVSNKPESEKLVFRPEAEVLPSNWSKYEIDENDELEGADFETLLQEPVCNDSYFKFKSEQNWNEDIKLNKYFTLDLKLLGEGISTVPFAKRHNYDEKLFTHAELESMKNRSEINSRKYKKYLEVKYPEKSNIIIKKNEAVTKTEKSTNEEQNLTDFVKTSISENEEKIREANMNLSQTEDTTSNNEIKIPKETFEIKIESKEQNKLPKDSDDDIDDLLTLKISQENIDETEIKAEDPLENSVEKCSPQNLSAPQTTVDLELWLDDILDE